MKTTENAHNTNVIRPDFWDDLVCQTLSEEGLNYLEVDLAEYPWCCDRLDETSVAYENDELTPLEARLEIFNIVVTLYADLLEESYEGTDNALDAQLDG
jgi:hypothetical protein